MFTANPFPDRQPGDLDVIAEISKLLQEAGHPSPYQWETKLGIIDPHSVGPKLQQFLANRYWRLKMGLCQEDSTMERYCLIESGDGTDYMKIFQSNALPFIIRNNLG